MYIVDRIEEGIVVLEYETNIFEININNLPDGIKEGDILIKQSDKFKILKKETDVIRNDIRSMFDNLKNK